MSAQLALPDDDTLRGFLLGTLPKDRADQVQTWLEIDPSHAARLGHLPARDSFLDAVFDDTTEYSVSVHAVDRVVRSVSDSLHSSTTVGNDTSAFLTDGESVADLRRSTQQTLPWPPTRLGGYQIVRELGHGGMGYVFEAEDETLGRRVAIKVLKPDLARKSSSTARFIREARAAAAVEHENVVPILHIDEHDGAPFIVMPLLKGESLASRLGRDGPLPVTDVIRIGRDVASGLGAAHAKGLVHRDLKPANIWLDAGTGRARVLDFGLARQGDGADAITDSGALMGTPAYMAPEQLDGKPASVRSDLFGLGAVLYECATGKRAFSGPTITAILKAVATHDPLPPTQVNPDFPLRLSTSILRLLAKNPADRPASAEEVADKLVGQPSPLAEIRERTAASVGHTTRPRGRRRWAVWVGAVAAVAAVLVLGVWVATRPSIPATPAEGNERPTESPPPATAPTPKDPPASTQFRGRVDVRLARTKDDPLLRLNEAGALPMQQQDTFRIEGEIDRAAYLYVVWVDPDHDVTPVYPWDPYVRWGTRPAKEEAVSKVSLPSKVDSRYTAPAAKPGVATMVMFARSTPLDVSDEVVKGWFESLPELPLPTGGARAAAWFDDYAEARDPTRLRTFGKVSVDDPFARWQGQLQQSLGGKASFQTAVSFARTGRK